MDDEDGNTSFPNITGNMTAEKEVCSKYTSYSASLAAIDIVTVLMGQPLTTQLLWITLASKKSKDILNLNLAFFHSVQYLISNIHLFVIFLRPDLHKVLLIFLYVFVQIGGPMSLTLICVERYIAVIHPTYFPLLKKYRCREFCASAVWFVALPPAFIFTFDNIISENTEKAQTDLGTVSYSIMMFMLGIMLYSSVSVARALRQSAVGKDVMHPVKRRAFITICVVSSIALFCYIPVSLLQREINTNQATCYILPICLLFLSAASIVHPLFYLSARGKLCNHCKKEQAVR